MAQEIKMSAAGLKAVQDELEYLKTVRRKELAEEIKEARSHGGQSSGIPVPPALPSGQQRTS